MRIHVLGPLGLHLGGTTLALGAPKQKVVLALLLARANMTVSVDALVDELWGDRPPPSALANVRLYANNLRRLLLTRPDAPILGRHGDGYAITLQEADLDLHRFRTLARKGRKRLRGGELTAAVSAFDEGIALWSGRAMADVPAGPILTGWQIAVEHERLSALEDRAETLLQMGAHDRVAADAHALLATESLRERTHALLIRAKYHAGDVAGALVAFEAARRCLREQLGVEPGEELRQLHRAVLKRDVALPQTILTAAPTRPAPAATPRQLPAAAAGFAGRVRHLQALDSLLSGRRTQRPRTVVVSAIEGTGGIGKTALAVYWAHRVADQFPDGQLYLNLRGFDKAGSPVTPADALRGFLDAFEVAPERIPADIDSRAALYRSLLAGKRILVVLDNARDVAQVRPLLPGSPGCFAVVTSRNQLKSLVAVEGAQPLALDVLTTDEARDLLANRLGPDRIVAEAEAVDEIITRCARLPLALVIVAARAATCPGFPLASVAEELRHARRGLDAFAGDDPLTDLRAVLSWSYQTLGSEAARLFRLLSLHPGPDTTAPAAASLTGVPPAEVVPPLGELARAHLVTEHAPGRYTFHDLLRVYGSELAHDNESDAERRSTIHRILDHYLHTARVAALLLQPNWDPITPAMPQLGVVTEDLVDHDQAMRWFTAEHRVLLTCMDAAAENGFDTHVWQFALTCATYLRRRGHWHDWVATHQAAVEAARRAGDEAGEARACRGLGRTYVRLCRYEDARAQLQRAVDLLGRLDDPLGQAHTHHNLAHLCEQQGHYREALHHIQRALILFRTVDHRYGEALALNSVGWYNALLGRHRLALKYCQQALRIHQALDDPHGEANTWDSLGYAHHHLGDYGSAVRCYQHAVDLSRKIDDRGQKAEFLERLGETHRAAGDAAAAANAWQQAAEILDELNHPHAAVLSGKIRELTVGHRA